MRAQLNDIMAHHTGTSLERIKSDTERDYIMDAYEAQTYGIIDEVIQKPVKESK